MGPKKVDPARVWKEYEKGIDFKTQLNLYDTVENNENFYIGKQWEGVVSNGCPTPVFDFIRRIVLFLVASVATDNLKLAGVSAPLQRADGVRGMWSGYAASSTHSSRPCSSRTRSDGRCAALCATPPWTGTAASTAGSTRRW